MEYILKIQYWAAISAFIVLASAIAIPPVPTVLQRASYTAPPDWPIRTGYVAFGDSYAAGIGAGATSEDDKCRIGANNYGNLLNQYTNNPNVDYQPRQCSGDTTAGLDQQITWWSTNFTKKADLATLTMGGNDVGFADFVKNCIITVTPGTTSGYRTACLADEGTLYELISKPIDDPTGLRFKLIYEYLRIMRLGRDDFHLYVTSYVRFFDTTSNDCDKTTFSYWRPGYDLWFTDGVLLTQDLRRELNRKVDAMNEAISSAVDEANKREGRGRIHFVDVNPRFEGHRWCKPAPGLHEPKEDREETYFFLSAWKDFDAIAEGLSGASKPQNKIPAGGINLPDASTCTQDIAQELATTGGVDPANSMACSMAKAIAHDPVGIPAQKYRNATEAYSRGDLNAQDIDGYWSTTERVKTFHPRTRGQVAYRDALVEAINRYQKGRSQICTPRGPLPRPAAIPVNPNTVPVDPNTVSIDPNTVTADPNTGPNDSNTVSAVPNIVPVNPNTVPVDQSEQSQQIAIASYISPLEHPELWDRMVADPKVTVLVMNVLNGPDTVVKPEWAAVIQKVKAANKKILGYVRTGYLGLASTDSGPFEPFETRDGSHKIPDWIAQVQRDTGLWYSLYGKDSIDGIFFDESHNECGANNEYAELYRFMSESVKRIHEGAMTVINPGTSVPQCYEDSADTIMTYESNYTQYVTSTYEKVNWKPKDPRKLWHIIYDVPEDKVDEVAKLGRENNAHLIQITDAKFPNPYSTLPSETYMQKFGQALSDGGKPLITRYTAPLKSLPDLPAPTLQETGHDFTSVSISWTHHGTENPYAFEVFDGGKEIVRLPGHMREVTIGAYSPGETGLHYSIRAIHTDHFGSADSNIITPVTNALTSAAIQNIVIDAKSSTKQTVYEADIYIPSGFVRIYFSDSDRNNNNWPGWPVAFGNGYVIAHYMVEGRTLHKYVGSKGEVKGNREWKWEVIDGRDTVKVIRDKYHYRWIVPVGTSNVDLDPEFIVMQIDGYTPRINHFRPCPSVWKGSAASRDTCDGKLEYDCQGSKPMCSIGLQVKKYCDRAAETLDRGPNTRDYFSSTTNATMSGNCRSNAVEGCRIFIQGNDENGQVCRFTGDELWGAYQSIRNQGHCGICGTKHFPNRCMVSVDYTPDCIEFGKSATGD